MEQEIDKEALSSFLKFEEALCKRLAYIGNENETVISHCFNAVKALDDTNNVNLKLAALYHDIGKYRHTINEKGHICFKCHNLHGHDFIKNDLFKHLKFPKETVDYVIGMTELHMSCLDTRKAIKRLLVKLTEKDINVRDLLLIRYADKKSNMLRENTTFNATWSKYKEVLKIVNEKAPMRVKELEISGIDIIEYFKLTPSPEIGRLLKIAFDAVTNEVINNDREEILEYLKNEV